MSRSRRSVPAWLPVAARAGYGLFLVLAPERLLAAGGRVPPAWAPAVARVLGLRHLLQAGVLAAHPQLAVPGAVVDLLHASTDIACAAVRTDLRIPPLLDAGIATALASSSLVTGAEGNPR